MKLNKDCVRLLLMYIENHCVYETDKFGDKRMRTVNLCELKDAQELSGITEDDLKYTIVKLFEGNYIKGDMTLKDSGVNFETVSITQLTLIGHDLLDNIRPENAWNKTKELLQKAGDFSLHIMSQLASEVMVAYTRSMINL